MNSTDNFKRPGRHRKPAHLDNFHRPRGAESTGSISFTPKASIGQASGAAIDDFRRPEGFNPAQQPTIPVSTRPPAVVLDNRPRNRANPTLPDAPPRRHGVKGRRSWRKMFKRSALSFAILAVLIGGFLGFKIYRNTTRVFKGNIFGIFDKTKLKGEDVGRVNIMLTGNSDDDPNHAGGDLTDSIMIISLDPVNNKGFIMSIPRDLWVNYESKNCPIGYEGKINAVFECGEQTHFKEDGFPEGGVGLMEKVIEDNFGIDINYYVKINYTAFRDAVNSVGGIDITIKTDDPRGLYDGNISKVDGGPLKLPNGTQHLNGQTALNLARARCDTVCYGFTRGDFDRTEHQRMMLFALKDKALSAGVISNPAKIGSLLDSVGNNVKTDFQTNEIRRLYDIGKQIQNQNLKSIGLADDNVHLVKTGMIGNSSVVMPVAGTYDFSQIKAFMKKLTSNDPVVQEGATAVVLNGSGVTGLARKKADELADKGITVKAVANTTTRQTTTIIFLNASKTQTSTYLSQKFKVTPTTDISGNPEAKNYDADFVIILGTDAQNTSQ